MTPSKVVILLLFIIISSATPVPINDTTTTPPPSSDNVTTSSDSNWIQGSQEPPPPPKVQDIIITPPSSSDDSGGPTVVPENEDSHHHHHGGGHSFSIIQFSYSDSSPFGPKAWDNPSIIHHAISPSSGEVFTRNRCGQGWLSPRNIDTSTVLAPDYESLVEDDEEASSSLTFTIVHRQIQHLPWAFGHPRDVSHGLEVHVPEGSLVVLKDGFEYVGHGLESGEFKGLSSATNYHLTSMSLFACDPNNGRRRSNHQIDGRRFPLELDFLFHNNGAQHVGRDRKGKGGGGGGVAVMVVVLGELGKEDNPDLEPLIKAAASYEGPSFEVNDGDEEYTVGIQGPWAPTWLLPTEASGYYYYDQGSWPVPPCFPIARVYVIKERIKLSARQLSILTSVKSVREPGGRMTCTASLLRNGAAGDNPTEVKYNDWPYKFLGNDGNPKREAKLREARERKEKEGEDETSRGASTTSSLRKLYCFVIIMAFFLNVSLL